MTEPAPSLGRWVCAWMESNLVHADGDYYGRPFRLMGWEKAFVWKCYELRQDGSRRYDRALLGLAKGSGKTELAAAVAVAEFAGPVVFDGWAEPGVPNHPVPRVAPDIPVAAASFEQADLLFGAAKVMVSAGPLSAAFDCFDTEILPKHGPGRLYRVAAAAGTNDGRRPTFFVADELHEWSGKKERVHLVLSNGRAKRSDAWELAISTAGWDPESLLGRMYDHGTRVEAGEFEDDRFLFEWHEGPEDVDLKNEEALREAIVQANPAAAPGGFASVESVARKRHEMPEFEFRRYFLNQWTESPERWLPVEVWDSRADPSRKVPDGARVVLGFDGSYNRDATAVVGATLEEKPHLFVVDVWERPGTADDAWRVDQLDVERSIAGAAERFKVEAIGCDPFRWQRTMQVLLEAGLPIMEFPSHSAARMAPACGTFEDAVHGGGLSHDGDERLARHIANCVTKTDSRGRRITKDGRDSPRHIDAAVAAVIAYDAAVRELSEAGNFYDDHDMRFL